MLSNFNIFIGNIAKWDSEKRSPTSPNQEGAGIEPQLIYEIKSDDGYHAKGTDLEGKRIVCSVCSVGFFIFIFLSRESDECFMHRTNPGLFRNCLSEFFG